MLRGSEVFGEEMIGGGNEIGKGVHLQMHFAGIVPGFAEFTAPANVGDSVNQAAIEKAQAVGTEDTGMERPSPP